MDNTDIRFRNKITFTQFLLSIGIVYQHTQWNYQGSKFLNGTQSFLFYLIETCVPFFFMISGYLFFRTYEPSKAKSKILSRGKTLLVPYLIWNAFYAVFMIALSKLGFIHNIEINKNVGLILLKLLNAEFSPLWFVKYLIIFTLISPIVYYLLRKKVLGAIFITAMIAMNIFFYCSGIMQIPINVNANNLIMLNYQYIFYAIGAYAALNWRAFAEKPKHSKSMVFGVVLIALITFYFLYGKKQENNVIINHCFRLIYICALWFVLDFLPEIKAYYWMKNSFFLYCSHLIVLQCAQRIIDIAIEKMGIAKPLLYVAEYILLPLVIICFLIVLAECMKNKTPKIYNILTGSRG